MSLNQDRLVQDSVTRFFASGFFHESVSPQPPEDHIRTVLYFLENSQRYSQVKVHHQNHNHDGKIGPHQVCCRHYSPSGEGFLHHKPYRLRRFPVNQYPFLMERRKTRHILYCTSLCFSLVSSIIIFFSSQIQISLRILQSICQGRKKPCTHICHK